MGFFNSLPLPESSKVIPAHPCPGLVVVASAHEGHLVSGEEGRASPNRERKRRERAIRLAHLVKINKLFLLASNVSGQHDAMEGANHLNRAQARFPRILSTPTTKSEHN